jgi:hypothetical protein
MAKSLNSPIGPFCGPLPGKISRTCRAVDIGIDIFEAGVDLYNSNFSDGGNGGGGDWDPNEPSGNGDLTVREVWQIQGVVEAAERPLWVVGSPAHGERRNPRADLPFGTGEGEKSNIDYLIPIPSDHAAFSSGAGSVVMASLIQSQPQRERTRAGSASSSSRKALTAATLSARVA